MITEGNQKKMARGDGLFARLDCDIWISRKMMRVKPCGAKAWYLMVWTLAVKERSSFLCRTYCRQYAQGCLQVSSKSSRRYEKICLDAGVVVLAGEDMLFVPGAKDCHPKIKWKDDGSLVSCGDSSIPREFPVRGSTRTEQTRTEEMYKRTDTNKDIDNIVGDVPVDKKGSGNIGSVQEIMRTAVNNNIRDKITGITDEILHGLYLPEKDRATIIKIVRDNDPRMIMNAFELVRDRIDGWREGRGDPVNNPIGLLRWHIKNLMEEATCGKS